MADLVRFCHNGNQYLKEIVAKATAAVLNGTTDQKRNSH
ncbi:MAG: hypothetical protein ACJAT0_000682 [Nonlabens sp.]|jgi:hypothetical protein